MSSPESRIVDLARDGKLEVENLLDLAFVGDIGTADFLKRNREEREGQGGIFFNDRTYQSWALVVEQFLRDGYSGLSKLSKGDKARYVVALLEHLHSEDSVLALMDLFSYVIDNCEKYADLSDRIVASINAILSFPPVVDIDAFSKERLRIFVHRYIGVVDEDVKYATAICALRSIGDESSINLIKNHKPLSGSWLGTENIVIKVIKSNIKKSQ